MFYSWEGWSRSIPGYLERYSKDDWNDSELEITVTRATIDYRAVLGIGITEVAWWLSIAANMLQDGKHCGCSSIVLDWQLISGSEF